jgi:hypothetical protein
MSSYSDLQQRIAQDYLNRSNFTDQIKRAILAAIRFYERQRWRFNETSTAIACSAGQSFLALPSNYLAEDFLQISASGGLMPLLQTDLQGILELRQTSSTGIPTHYCIQQNRIEIAIVPDSAYSCPLYYIKTLTELSADSDTNAWTTGLHQDLIVHHATKLLWANTLRNTQEAVKHADLERLAMSQLSMEQMQFSHLGLKPTQF